MVCNIGVLRGLLFGALVLLNGCSRGGLYDGEATYDEYVPDVGMKNDSVELELGLNAAYKSLNSLFWGAGSDYDEVIVFSPKASFSTSSSDLTVDNGLVDKSMKKVVRHLVRRNKPLDLQSAILQPQTQLDLFQDSTCVLTLSASLQAEDQCDGALKCKLYRVDSIYTDEKDDTCNWPIIKSFVVKFSRNLQTAEVIEPGTENWRAIEKLNHFDARASAIRIAPDSDPFSSVVATTSMKGFVFAGKRYNKPHAISAAFPDLIGTSPIRTEDLDGVPASSYFRNAQTRNVLLVATSVGVYKVNSEDAWELLPLPVGLSGMPTNVKAVLAISSVGSAAFRFIYDEGAVEKNLILTYKEQKNAIEELDLTDVALDGVSSANSVPSGWELTIVNDNLWFWNPLAPALSKKFDEKEKKWVPITLSLPVMPEAGETPRHLLSPAGDGFVVTLAYTKNIKIASLDTHLDRKVYRHFYYDRNSEAQGIPIDTFSGPDAMHVLDGKAYFERVSGVSHYGGNKAMDYGYIYDFLNGKGKMFSDTGFTASGNNKREGIYVSSGIIVNDQAVLFYGGCEELVDNQQCNAAANSSARLVKFSSY